MRPRALITLAAVLACVLAGCGGNSGTGSDATLKVGLSLPALDEYYSVVKSGAEDEAKKKGVTLLQAHGKDAADPSQQIAKIQDLLAQQIDVLAISPPGDALKPVLDRARKLGVKVIFVDQQLEDWKHASTFIGTDNPQGSELMGKYLLDKLGGKGEVGIMVGIPGVPLVVKRYQNLKKTLEAGGVKVTVSSETDGCQLDTAVPIVKNFLVAHPSVDAMYSICGPTGLAVDKVLADRQGGKKVLSTSWDVLVQQVNNIVAGKETAAVAQFPQRLGAAAIDAAIKVDAGKKLPAYIDNGTEIVTVDNADTYFHDGTSGYAYKLKDK